MKKRFGRIRSLSSFLVCVLLVSALLSNAALANNQDFTVTESKDLSGIADNTGGTTTFASGTLNIGSSDRITLTYTTGINAIALTAGQVSIQTKLPDAFEKVEGHSELNSVLINSVTESEYYVPVTNTFSSITGKVTLAGNTTIVSGNATIKGTNASCGLTVKGGNITLSGTFNKLDIQGGSVTITGDTTIGNGGMTLTDGQKLIISDGKKLTANSKTLRPNAEVTFTNAQWPSGTGTLPASETGYSEVGGLWKLGGNVKLLSVANNNEATIEIPPEITLTAADNSTGGNKINVRAGSGTAAGSLNIGAGYTVTVNTAVTKMENITVNGTDSTVTLPKELEAIGNLTVSAGTVKLTENEALTASGTVTLDGGDLEFASKAQLTGGDQRAFQNTATSAVTLQTWGVLPSGEVAVALFGEWDLPAGVSATVSRASGNENGARTTVNGLGGTLTPSGANVYGKGYFEALNLGSVSNTGGPLMIAQGDTVCTAERSMYPITPITDAATVIQWGTVPGVKTDNYEEAPVYRLTGTWNMAGEGENFTVKGTACTCANSNHDHGEKAIIGGTAAGTVWVIEGSVDAADGAPVTITVAPGGSSTVVGDGQTVLTLEAGATANIKGIFKSVTGSVVLVGNTTIKGTNGSVTVTGGGQELILEEPLTAGKALVQGVFASLNTKGDVTDGEVDEGDITVKLAGDVEIQAGKFSIDDADAKDFVATIAGGTGEIQGAFKQIVVTGGTVIDSGTVTLRNLGTCLLITGKGDVELDNQPNIAFTESCLNGTVIEMSGGELRLLNGTVEAKGGNSRTVSLSAAKFRMGPPERVQDGEGNLLGSYTDLYEAGKAPKLTVNGQSGVVVDVGLGAEVWLHAGEIFFEGLYSKGVDVVGNAHLYPNEQYGDAEVTDPLLYIHGGDQAEAAMWINAGGNFDIRGRGVLLEEPSPYNDGRFALYIHENANLEQILNKDPDTDTDKKDKYPLSGGTFNGKVYYYKHDLADLIAPNHYLRYDETTQQFGATDGTYGVVVSSAADRADTVKNYGSYEQYHGKTLDTATLQGDQLNQFGKHDFYYSIADAEWELRAQMTADGGKYQIPAGIVNRKNDGTEYEDNADGIVLDTNVFELPATSPASSIWGMGKKKGDVEVENSGHVLYLAGRKISYTEKNRGDDLLSGIWATAATGGNGYDHAENTLGDDASNLFYLKPDSELTLRDCVFDKDGVDTKADETTGGYIGTGTLDRQGGTDAFCRAIYNGGTLHVVSARILSVKEAIFTVSGSTTNIGEDSEAYGTLTNGEDNSNLLIDIIGNVTSVSMQGANAVNVYGGVVGNVEGADADACGIENRDNQGVSSKLNVYGGIITGTGANGVGIRTTSDGTGVTTIHGGAIYGRYEDDEKAGSAALSLYVNGGTVFLNIDEAHGIDKSRPGERFLITKVPEDLITSATHHIGNVKTENGKLYVGVDSDQDTSLQTEKAISEHSRINGTLDCIGGTTVFYQGVVYGTTTVTGKDTGADYTTEFFVNDGHFTDLAFKGTGPYTFNPTAPGGKRLDERIQIHGGAYHSISTVNLGNSIGVQDILGFWNDQYNMDEKSAPNVNDWIRYNHYAERNVSGTQDASGYWVNPTDSKTGWIQDVPAKLSDTERAPNEGTLTAAANSAIVVRDALWEFHNWLTKDNPGSDDTLGDTFTLTVNLWLDTTNPAPICEPYFHCIQEVNPQYPLQVGAGTHQVDLNKWGIFGKNENGALIQNQASSELILTNTKAPSTGTIPANERRIRNLAAIGNHDAQVIAVADGTLTIQREDDRGKGALILRASGTAVTVNKGTLTMNAGFLDGAQNGLEVIEAGKVFLTSGSENLVVTADGEPSGKILTMAETDGITIEGRNRDGIINAGELTITGVSGKQVKIAGQVNGITLKEGGWVNASTAEITGTQTGLVNSESDALNEPTDGTVGHTITLKAVKLTGKNVNGLTMAKGTLYTENSEITGETAAGIEMTGGTAFANKTTITGKTKGILNSSSQADNDEGFTIKLYNTCVVEGQTNIGIESSAGVLDATATAIFGGPGANGVYLTGSANANIHAGTQVLGNNDARNTDLPALRCDSTGKVYIDGGSFARGLYYGVKQENGEFEIVGGNLGDYTMDGADSKLTVKDGVIASTNTITMPQFVSVTQSAGKADIGGGATMGNYTHTGGTVEVNVNPTFTTFTGNDDGSEANPVTLNSGHYQILIENTSGKLMDLIGENAMVICDGGITGGSYSQEDRTDQAIEDALLEAETRLETKTYTVNGEKINLAASFSITSNLLNRVEMENLPDKTAYVAGEKLEMAGAKLKLIYEDGQTRTLNLGYLDEETPSEREDQIEVHNAKEEIAYGPNGAKLEAGEQELTVSYKRKKNSTDDPTMTCTFKVKVYEKELVSIALETAPEKLNYLQGTSPANIDRTGGMVMLTYNDDTTKPIELTDSVFTLKGRNGAEEFDAETLGAQVVRVYYTQTLDNTLQNKDITKTTSFTITVHDSDIASFDITKEPDRKEYLEGDADQVTLDLTGCEVTLNYRDGTKEENVKVSDLGDLITPSGFNPRKIGDNTVTLTYQAEGKEKHTAAFTVTVLAKTPASVKVSAEPQNSEFLEKKGTLDLSGGKLEVAYDNGDTKEVAMTASAVEISRDLDNTQTGSQTILFTYTENGTTVETAEADGWQVTVIPKTLTFLSMAVQPTVNEYLEGKDALDLTGARLKLNFDNGDEETVDLKDNADFEVTGFDNTTPGMQQLTVKSKANPEIFTRFSVKITPKALTKITVKTAPVNPNYRDTPLDLTGGILNLIYDNDTTEELSMQDSAVKVTGYDSSPSVFKDGEKQITQTLTAAYEKQTVDFEVTILNRDAVIVTDIAVKTDPAKVRYAEGEALDLTGGVLDVTYSDGDKAELSMTDPAIAVSGFRPYQIGDQTVTLTYQGTECSCEVRVSVAVPYTLTAEQENGVSYQITVNTSSPEKSAVLVLSCYDPETDRMLGTVRKTVDLSAAENLTGTLEPPADTGNCVMVLSLLDAKGASLCEAVQLSAS